MPGTMEWKKQTGDHLDLITHRNEGTELHPNACGGCHSCHETTRIHTSGSLKGWSGDGGGGDGSGQQKPCATNFFQSNLGNNYIHSLMASRPSSIVQKKCNCGGSCSCSSEKEEEQIKIQTKLIIGAAYDAYEQEADHVADITTNMPSSSIQTLRKEHFTSIQRRSMADTERTEQSGSIDVGQKGGEPLSFSTRHFMESRFGADLSNVRLHTDDNAHKSAAAIQARAYTSGSHIWMGKGETQEDKNLIAHELTHVIQQSKTNPITPTVQRTVVVNPGEAEADDILGQFNTICPSVTFSRSGRNITCNESSVASYGCGCLTDVASDPDRRYTIQVFTMANNPATVTLHDGTTTSVPNPSPSGPQTDISTDPTNPTVYMPASGGADIEIGAFSPSGTAIWCTNPRILGHELCGHARLNQDCEAKGDRPSHNSTIDTENIIAGELGEPARGHYTNFRQGESFHNAMGDPKIVFKLINGWHYEAP